MVSICIPTYARLGYLQEAVASVLNQTYAKFEICVSLDPSPEGPNQEIHNWCLAQVSKHPNFKYNVNSFNLGLAGNWNKLAEMASGEFLMIMGDDDRLLPKALERFVENFSSGPDVIFANQYVINSKGDRLEDDYNLRYGRSLLTKGLLENSEAVIWSNSLPMSSSLIRAEFVREFRFKEDLNTPEIEFFLRLAAANKKFFFVPEVLTEYRIHDNSATSQGLKVHRLMQYLIHFPVGLENEQYKTKFLKNLAYPSINRWIVAGDHSKAKEIYFSKYYGIKNAAKIRGIVQLLLLYLPNSFSNRIMKFIKQRI